MSFAIPVVVFFCSFNDLNGLIIIKTMVYEHYSKNVTHFIAYKLHFCCIELLPENLVFFIFRQRKWTEKIQQINTAMIVKTKQRKKTVIIYMDLTYIYAIKIAWHVCVCARCCEHKSKRNKI